MLPGRWVVYVPTGKLMVAIRPSVSAWNEPETAWLVATCPESTRYPGYQVIPERELRLALLMFDI